MMMVMRRAILNTFNRSFPKSFAISCSLLYKEDAASAKSPILIEVSAF